MFSSGVSSVLTQDRINLLESIGFVWNTHSEKWDENFKQLQQYAQKYGHCNVPRNCNKYPKLSTWVKRQRHQFVSGSMSAERAEKLEAIGFVWDIRNFQAAQRRQQYELVARTA